jgi:hypothetical protein
MGFGAGQYTVTLGGSLIAVAGGRLTTTLSIPGARSTHHVRVTPQTDLGASALYGGFVSANDVVTVWIMGVLSLTPPSTVFNVSVSDAP